MANWDGTKWEYGKLTWEAGYWYFNGPKDWISHEEDFSGKLMANIFVPLEFLGERGWELCLKESEDTYFFKRPRTVPQGIRGRLLL